MLQAKLGLGSFDIFLYPVVKGHYVHLLRYWQEEQYVYIYKYIMDFS